MNRWRDSFFLCAILLSLRLENDRGECQPLQEEFRYDRGRKTGPAVLVGASGATRKGQRKDGQWNGKAVFTSQNGEVKEEMWDMGRKM